MFRLVGSAPPEILGGLKSDAFRAKLQKHLGQVHQYHVLGEFFGDLQVRLGAVKKNVAFQDAIPFTLQNQGAHR